MANGQARIASLQRPALSTMSASDLVYGSDWPEWQRNLYPVTYQTDRAHVEQRLYWQRKEVELARRFLHRMLKAGDRRAAARYRENLEKHSTYVRNCETQLRLIDATAAYLASQKAAA